MISTSNDYKTAIDAPTRRIVPNAVIDLTDPDLDVTSVTGDYASAYSFTSQIADKDMTFSGAVYATLETSRWLLDGSQSIMPDTPSTRSGEQGVLGDTLSGTDGSLNKELTVAFNDVELLQSVTVASTDIPADGHPKNITLEVYSNSVVMHTATATMDGSFIIFDGFTVTQPDKIVLTVNSWSLPGRRYRFVEFLPGHIETWYGDTIYKFDVIRKCDISNLTLPYASATLEIDNTDKRFDPMNKDGIFLTLTARQPVTMSLGVEINGSVEYVPGGIYYLKDKGWKTQNSGMTMMFDMIDIVGLLASRKFVLSGSVPSTLEGWVSEIVDQLGTTFSGHYVIDGTLGTTALTCSADDVAGVTCGDLLRYVCQAVGAFPVSDPENGYLHITKINNSVRRQISLRSQNAIPSSSANQDIAFLSFKINGTDYNIPGTEEIGGQTVNIENPFITTLIGADLASQAILPQYGGNALSLNWRGDMSVDPGDVEIVEIYPNILTAARVTEQRLTLANGVMTNVPMGMLQADGASLYTDYILITESGTYTMPAGITDITIVLIGGGDGGQGGMGGTTFAGYNYGGNGGLGGKVYTAPIEINDGQSVDIVIGNGGNGGAGGQIADMNNPIRQGQPGQAGGDTTADFGIVYSSANGVRMDHGYVDLLTNEVYGVPGVRGLDSQDPPKAGNNAVVSTGNGGNGGDAGRGAIWEWDDPQAVTPGVIWIEDALPGKPGGRGADGVCIIFYVR